ncbi:MAG: hypothetical protein M5U09_18905 [Gammaproteobacteria bacterium]|nr:hypothetical protein [Gammaproteobacteria bacterium]
MHLELTRIHGVAGRRGKVRRGRAGVVASRLLAEQVPAALGQRIDEGAEPGERASLVRGRLVALAEGELEGGGVAVGQREGELDHAGRPGRGQLAGVDGGVDTGLNSPGGARGARGRDRP